MEVIKIGVGSKASERDARSQMRFDTNQAGWATRRLFEKEESFRAPTTVRGFDRKTLDGVNGITPEDMANSIFEASVLLKGYGPGPVTDDGQPIIIRKLSNTGSKNNILDNSIRSASLQILDRRKRRLSVHKEYLKGGRFPNKNESYR